MNQQQTTSPERLCVSDGKSTPRGAFLSEVPGLLSACYFVIEGHYKHTVTAVYTFPQQEMQQRLAIRKCSNMYQKSSCLKMNTNVLSHLIWIYHANYSHPCNSSKMQSSVCLLASGSIRAPVLLPSARLRPGRAQVLTVSLAQTLTSSLIPPSVSRMAWK